MIQTMSRNRTNAPAIDFVVLFFLKMMAPAHHQL